MSVPFAIGPLNPWMKKIIGDIVEECANDYAICDFGVDFSNNFK
jgi:hypothetical protein